MLGPPYAQGLPQQLSRTKNCGPSTTSHLTITSIPTWWKQRDPLNTRFKEHCILYKPTGVGDHCISNVTGPSVYIHNLKVLGREQDWMERAPSMNIDQGYQLPHIYSLIIPPSEPHLHYVINIWSTSEHAIVLLSVPKWVKFHHFQHSLSFVYNAELFN